MEYTIYPELTKEYILNKISEKIIFEYYFQIPVLMYKPIVSPIRDDTHPSCTFYYNTKGVLKFRDFTGHFWGDCFDAVAYISNQNNELLKLYNINFININTSKGFYIVLNIIAKDFKLHKYEKNQVTSKIIITKEDYTLPKIEKKDVIFKVKLRDFNTYDKDYWFGKYYLSKNDLKIGQVYVIDLIWINDNEYPFYYYNNKEDVCYGYYFGKINNIDRWKFIFPNRKKEKFTVRFLTNTNIIQGLHLIKDVIQDDIFVLNKSYKDTLVLSRLFSIRGLSKQSESEILTQKEYDYIDSKFEYKFSLFDYDNTGIKAACTHRRKYDIQPMFLTDTLWNRKKGLKGCKDISDYLSKFGIQETFLLLDEYFYNNLYKYQSEFYKNFKTKFNKF